MIVFINTLPHSIPSSHPFFLRSHTIMFKLLWPSPFPPASTCLVGTLTRWDPSTHQTSSPREIYSTDDIYIGRDKRAWYNPVFLTSLDG